VIAHAAAMLRALAIIAASAAPAAAHDGRPLAPHDLWSAWEWNPAVTAPLAMAAALYALGVRRVWARSAPGRGVRRRDAMSFAIGWFGLFVALVSPLHALGGVLFSAHMTQHELMMVLAAPLIVLGRPLVAFVWASPPAFRRAVGSWTRRTAVRTTWRALTNVGVAWWSHAAALAVWHLPAPYEATLSSSAAHGLQHVSFLSTALLFWWAVLQPTRARQGASLAYLFVATLITGALGALLAFAPDLWYPSYAATTGLWGLTPMQDQQLGGIIMWVPGGASYLIAALAIVAAWLRDSERRSRANDAQLASAGPNRWRAA
jgi:cytochrome c oxidase assembly factor CtaG